MIIDSPWSWPNRAPAVPPPPPPTSRSLPAAASSSSSSGAAPTAPARPINPANLELMREAALKRRAIRGTKAYSQAAGDDQAPGAETQPAKTHQPIYATAAGRNILVPGAQGYRIAIYAFSAYNTVQQTIRLLDDTRDLQGVLTDFPAASGLFLPNDAEPYFVLDYGAPLVLELTAGTDSGTTGAVAGFLKYRMLEKWGN